MEDHETHLNLIMNSGR